MFEQPAKKRVDSTKFGELMQLLSVPRLNGSDILKATRRTLSSWLDQRGIEHDIHRFRLYPYFMEIGGLWLVSMLSLLTASVLLRWGWVSICLAGLTLVVVVMEMRGVHLLSRLAPDQGENIVIEFNPRQVTQREVILSAHYDSKTELLDDKRRAFFIGKLPLSMAIMILVGLLGVLDSLIRNATGWWASVPYALSLLLTIPMLVLLLPIGINAIFGRFAPPSQGAVDNGAGCAILLTVAEHLASKNLALEQTRVTIVLFCGEEIVVQGSRAYVEDRTFPYPTMAINLDLMGQNGKYVVWSQVGSPLQAYPADAELNALVTQTVADLTGDEVRVREGPVGTDSLPFLVAGIPATTIGSLDTQIGFDGLHSPLDNVDRIAFGKLSESVVLLEGLLRKLDAK